MQKLTKPFGYPLLTRIILIVQVFVYLASEILMR